MSDPENIPDSLRDALKDAFGSVDVPQGVDRAVLSGARAHLLRRRWKPLVGVAAAIAVVGGVALWSMQSHDAPRQVAMERARSTPVTILDALSAARRGDALAADELAKRAVTLEGMP